MLGSFYGTGLEPIFGYNKTSISSSILNYCRKRMNNFLGYITIPIFSFYKPFEIRAKIF